MTELHPQLKAMLEDVATANYPDQIDVPIDEARRITVERAQRFYGPAEPVARIKALTIPGPTGGPKSKS
jgi:hypothetical protein